MKNKSNLSIREILKIIFFWILIILFGYGAFFIFFLYWTVEHSERLYQLATWNRVSGEVVSRDEVVRSSHGKRKNKRSYKVALADVAYWVDGDLQIKTVEYSDEQKHLVVYYNPSKVTEIRLAGDLKTSLFWFPIIILLDIAFIVSFCDLCKRFIRNQRDFLV